MNPIRNKHIVIAVDGSENSRRAVAYVGQLIGGLTGFTVTLLHVIHTLEIEQFSANRLTYQAKFAEILQ